MYTDVRNINKSTSPVLEQIHKLTIAAEYSVLIIKMNLMNQIQDNIISLSPDEVAVFCNNNNILYTDKEDLKNLSKSINVYRSPDDPDEAKRFRQILGIVTCPKLDVYIEDAEVDESITMITEEYYDEIYEKLCDRLNEIESEYGDIVDSLKKQ